MAMEVLVLQPWAFGSVKQTVSPRSEVKITKLKTLSDTDMQTDKNGYVQWSVSFLKFGYGFGRVPRTQSWVAVGSPPSSAQAFFTSPSSSGLSGKVAWSALFRRERRPSILSHNGSACESSRRYSSRTPLGVDDLADGYRILKSNGRSGSVSSSLPPGGISRPTSPQNPPVSVLLRSN